MPLDLQASLDGAYAEARYENQLIYGGDPPAPPLLFADGAWAAAQVAAWRVHRAG